MMKRTLLILVIVLLTLSACGGSVDPTDEAKSQGQKSSSVVIPTSTRVLEDYILEATETVADQQEEPVLTEEVVPIESTDPIIELAQADLARRLGVEPSTIVLVYKKGIVWPDATLGCGKPGMDFTPVETPGFILEFVVGSIKYTYHTDSISRVIICPDGEDRPDTIFITP